MTSIYTSDDNPHFQYVLGLGDDTLILGQRWSEWLSKAPSLELDIASSNLALDLIGQSDLWLKYAAELEDDGRTSDDLAYLRDTHDFRCHWLTEQPNGDWGVTIARMLMFSIYQHIRYERLAKSSDERIAEIANKGLKEITYHRRFTSEWAVRLGKGTEESKARIQKGLNQLWRFVPELFETTGWEQALADKGVAVASSEIRDEWDTVLDEVLEAADLDRPGDSNGRVVASRHDGHHSEHLGHLLCEMQFLQRAYPSAQGAKW